MPLTEVAQTMADEIASNDRTRARGVELVKSPELTDLIQRGPGVARVRQRTSNHDDEQFRAYTDAKVQSG